MRKHLVLFLIFSGNSMLLLLVLYTNVESPPSWAWARRRRLENASRSEWDCSVPVLLREDPTTYFLQAGNATCFKGGLLRHPSNGTGACECNEGYFGNDCGIPSVVWFSMGNELARSSALRRRQRPRRIVQGSPVNHEVSMFTVKLAEIGDVVDLFLLGESNYSVEGSPKGTVFLDLLRDGTLDARRHRILHVFQDHYPEAGLTDGWYADSYARNHMFREGLKCLANVREDDLFLLLDADEIPSKEVLLFLKLYDGYPFPVRLSLRWTIFGYFWGSKPVAITTVTAVTTFQNMAAKYDSEAIRLRGSLGCLSGPLDKPDPSLDQPWCIGSETLPAGFHCSWCSSVEGIIKKLLHANREDKPRWGDDPQKLEPAYIRSLISKGQWFDDQSFFAFREFVNDTTYAPAHVLRNANKYACLLFLNHKNCPRETEDSL